MFLLFLELGTIPTEITTRGCTDIEADLCLDTMQEDTDPSASFVPETSVTCVCSEDACNDGAIDTIKVPDCEYSFNNLLRVVRMPKMTGI